MKRKANKPKMKEEIPSIFVFVDFLYGIPFRQICIDNSLNLEEYNSMVHSYTETLNVFDMLDMGHNALEGIRLLERSHKNNEGEFLLRLRRLSKESS